MMWVLAVSFHCPVFKHLMGQGIWQGWLGLQSGSRTGSALFLMDIAMVCLKTAGQMLAQMAVSSEASSQYALVVSHPLPVLGLPTIAVLKHQD